MSRTCDYCRGPIAGTSLLGRPLEDRAVAEYCCYGCLSIGESSQGTRRNPGLLDGFSIRLGIGLLIAGQSMIFGLAINLEEQTTRMVKLGVQGAILAGTLLVIALLGWPLFRSAFDEFRRGRVTIEALFLLTMTGAMFASLQSFITGDGPVYFEVVSIVLVVYSLGKLIGARSRAAALASARAWSNPLKTCRLVEGQNEKGRVEVATVLPGDLVEVHAGETIAVDGVIREGIGFVSEAPVTGEPFAVVKRRGDSVLAGMISHDAVLRIEATAPGSARQIDKLVEAVEAARERPTSLQAQADRIGRVFLPFVIAVALITFVIWTYLSGWRTGLFNSMSVLLVACPCALGLATPIVIWSALNRLAARGLVAHSGDAIERLAQVDRVVFDKTGTLTEEHFAVVDIATLAEGNERARILGWLSLIEAHSDHPIAKPFAALPRTYPMNETPRIVAHRTIPGCGVEAELEVGRTVHRLRVGRPDWICSSKSETESLLFARLRVRDGHRIDFAIDGKLAAIAFVAERLRDSAHDAVAALRNLRLPVTVLTGDTTERATALGMGTAEGNLLPDDKRERIEQVQQAGDKALMIGDGINDASALATAHAGIGLASGTELANGAASATLYHGDLRTIPWAIAFSRMAMQTVRRNLLRAAAYNLVGISLAAFGVLQPVAAALLMAISSLLVAWSSVRVGAGTDVCPCDQPIKEVRVTKSDRPIVQAAVHALAFAGQAVCAALLLDLNGANLTGTIAAFMVLGIVSGYWWYRSPKVPHWLDMAYGMITLGNLGMLIGWWADNGFTRLRDAGCSTCVQAMCAGQFKPWMWAGMLIGANAAMFLLQRRAYHELASCRTAMFVGGNPGMILGMLAGGSATTFIAIDSVTGSVLIACLGMTVGMVAGMLAGTAMARWILSRSQVSGMDPAFGLSTSALREDATAR